MKHNSIDRSISDKESGANSSVCSRLARSPLLPAAEGADGHLRADAAAACPRLAHQETAAGETEAASQRVPDRAG